MSDHQTPMGYMNPQQQQQYDKVQSPVAAGYIPTDDEKRVFRECNQESFYYRSLPFSTAAMTITQLLISRGFLTPSPRFGSLPKVAFAGLIGYIGGKISYTKICQEKFKNIENSPLGEALRQGQHHLPQQFMPQNQTEFSDPDQPGAYIPAFQSAIEPRAPSDSESYSNDFSYSGSARSEYQPGSFNSSATKSARDDSNQQECLDETLQKKQVLYEDLRSKNRDIYEVTMTQRADTLVKAPIEKAAAKKDVKKNQYGDALD